MIEMENPESWIPESMQAHRLLVKSPKTRTFPQRPRFPIVLPIGDVKVVGMTKDTQARTVSWSYAIFRGFRPSTKIAEEKKQRTVTRIRSVGPAVPCPSAASRPGRRILAFRPPPKTVRRRERPPYSLRFPRASNRPVERPTPPDQSHQVAWRTEALGDRWALVVAAPSKIGCG